MGMAETFQLSVGGYNEGGGYRGFGHCLRGWLGHLGLDLGVSGILESGESCL
jgi:hypothetical protein